MPPANEILQSAIGEAAPKPGNYAEDSLWFNEEVEPHERALRAWLHARFPWVRDVEDIAQEASFRLWRRRRAGGDIRSAKATLFTIARNAVFDLGRRRMAAVIEPVAEIHALAGPDERADIVEAVSTREELEFLADALRDLPDRCRQVLTLRKMYGHSQRDVAERLGISEHTVHALVAKGMRRCSDHLRRRGIMRRPE